MGAVRAGDRVLGADGRPTTVVHAFDVLHNRPCYELTFSDGSTIVADADHLWRTTTRAERRQAELQAVARQVAPSGAAQAGRRANAAHNGGSPGGRHHRADRSDAPASRRRASEPLDRHLSTARAARPRGPADSPAHPRRPAAQRRLRRRAHSTGVPARVRAPATRAAGWPDGRRRHGGPDGHPAVHQHLRSLAEDVRELVVSLGYRALDDHEGASPAGTEPSSDGVHPHLLRRRDRRASHHRRATRAQCPGAVHHGRQRRPPVPGRAVDGARPTTRRPAMDFVRAASVRHNLASAIFSPGNEQGRDRDAAARRPRRGCRCTCCGPASSPTTTGPSWPAGWARSARRRCSSTTRRT